MNLVNPHRPGLELLASLESEAVLKRTIFAGGEMVWRCWGQGAPLILVHGGGGSWGHWVRNITPLSRNRQVWCPDLPAFGDSDMPAGGLAAIVDAAVAGLNVLFPGARSLDLVGFSFGGVLATLAAAQHGGVGRLVLVGSTGLGLRLPDVTMRSWLRETGAKERAEAHRRNLFTLMLAHPVDDPLAEYVHAISVERGRFDGRRFGRSAVVLETLPRLQCRVFGIWGELDITTPDGAGSAEAALRGAASLAGFVEISNAGHWVQYEKAERFNAALEGFLDLPQDVVTEPPKD